MRYPNINVTVLLIAGLRLSPGCGGGNGGGALLNQRSITEPDPANLKSVAVAFHTYHDKHNHFPRADSAGDKDSPKGLSWRVHLLPHLGQEALYKEFHLNEPWDSPHNKQLIFRMPDVYKTHIDLEAGKTAMNVFVGPRVLFSEERPTVARVIDGQTQTLLAVNAGADIADIWTKPGGLPYDPNGNPWDLLGNVGNDGFVAVGMANFLWRIPKSTTPKDLHSLIQRRDGKFFSSKARRRLRPDK